MHKASAYDDNDTDFAVSHQILQRFRVHACLGLIAAVGMAADVRRDVRHLNAVNLIVLADHAVETVFPVQRHQRHTVIVKVQETAISQPAFSFAEGGQLIQRLLLDGEISALPAIID